MRQIGGSRARPFGVFSPESDAPSELYQGTHWFACRTRPRAEKKADQLLRRSGFETYLPVVEEDRRWSDRVKRVGLPLFPGYVFVHFALARIGEVLHLPLIATVARPNGYPTPVRAEELEAVRTMVDGANEAGLVPEPEDYLQPGDPVRVVDGPFVGMEGTLLEVNGASRVMVRIGALRQASSVAIPRRMVEPVSVAPLQRRPAAP